MYNEIIQFSEIGGYKGFKNRPANLSSEDMSYAIALSTMEPDFWRALAVVSGWKDRKQSPFDGGYRPEAIEVAFFDQKTWQYKGEQFHQINLNKDFKSALSFLYNEIRTGINDKISSIIAVPNK